MERTINGVRQWSQNGLIWYRGEQPSPRNIDVRPIIPPIDRPVYDPTDAVRTKNTRDQIAVEIARQLGDAVQIDAHGELRVAAAKEPQDPRLTKARRGRKPVSRTELNQWLKDSDEKLLPKDCMALTLQYEAHYGWLPERTRDEEAAAKAEWPTPPLAGPLPWGDRKVTERLIQEQIEQDEANRAEARQRTGMYEDGLAKHRETLRQVNASLDELYRRQHRTPPGPARGGVRVGNLSAHTSYEER